MSAPRVLFTCDNDDRRTAVRERGAPRLNGIDFVEVSPDQTTLAVTFIHNLPDAPVNPVPNNLPQPLTAENVVITGGVRIRTIRVAGVARTADNVLTVKVDAPGDFSPYTLRLVAGPADAAPPPGFDARLAEVTFTFKIDCPRDSDCKSTSTCPAPDATPQRIDYLAKDYESFRRVMLDRMALLAPGWDPGTAADVGMVLVELLAAVGDSISYAQDAVATEAYLGTARRRTSVRRHARLVDYRMHDGRNARAWVQVRVTQDAPAAAGPAMPAGTWFVTRLTDQAGYVPTLSASAPVPMTARVFESMADVPALFVAHNRMPVYAWGQGDCCLPRGATAATLRGAYPELRAGDVVILAEEVNPSTGGTADADASRRHAVRLTQVDAGTPAAPRVDPLDGTPVTEIAWHADDALPFPLCISTRTDELHGSRAIGDATGGVSVALGNLVLVDHGSGSMAETLGPVSSSGLTRAVTRPNAGATREPVPPRFAPTLKETNLTQAGPAYDAAASASAATNARPMDGVLPAITLTGGAGEDWPVRRDLLASTSVDRGFVVETEADGAATLRFGDDEHGRRPAVGDTFKARYRVGNGAAGNVPAGAIAHVRLPLPGVKLITNPLPASGGVEPESIESVRQLAPFAFRTQERAVTAADYAELGRRRGDLQRVQATTRWTGSWNTVFVTADRHCGRDVDRPFRDELRDYFEPFRMAGQDLDVDAPRFVPLEIELELCVKEGYLAADVKQAVAIVLRRMLAPDNYTFGQPVYLSPLIASAQGVDGVDHVSVVTAQRQGDASTDARAAGVIPMGRLEVARLDDDPNYPDRGALRLTPKGGQ